MYFILKILINKAHFYMLDSLVYSFLNNILVPVFH